MGPKISERSLALLCCRCALNVPMPMPVKRENVHMHVFHVPVLSHILRVRRAKMMKPLMHKTLEDKYNKIKQSKVWYT